MCADLIEPAPRGTAIEWQLPVIPKWYWAAIGSMARKHHGVEPGYSQCELARLMLSRTTCCDDPGTCNEEISVQKTLEELKHLGPTAPGGLDDGMCNHYLGQGSLVIFEESPAWKGDLPRFYLLLECWTDGSSSGPVPLDTHVKEVDLRSGEVTENTYRYPHTLHHGCVRHYVTVKGR